MTEPSSSPSLDRIIEAALLASGEPLGLDQLLVLFDEYEQPSRGEIRAALSDIERRLEGSAMALIESASGFRLVIDHSLSRWVSRLWEERPQRYSRALLETLALIAYRQPVTRGDIEEVRGVSISATIMRTLHERGWIRVVGHRDVPGRPAVYATTRSFLDDLGLRTLEDLPPMAELAEQFADVPDDTTASEDAETSAAMAATQALLQNTNDDLEEDELDAAMDTSHLEITRLDFGQINERLNERMRNRSSAHVEAADIEHDESAAEDGVASIDVDENATEHSLDPNMGIQSNDTVTQSPHTEPSETPIHDGRSLNKDEY
ncbi:Segregation and condensation protein B [Halomonadaceae bacterium LMG 33818]|uniref:SMC-Scp complex subunit ScpB n=1 Tax=Cernens ardua TaxID=3402176 RepID=UPI003EDB9EDF